MARSEAQRAADKRYREAHKGDSVTWTTKFKTGEAAEIDAIIKESGKTRAEFIRWAIREWEKNNQQ